jgi:hypothetical protein
MSTRIHQNNVHEKSPQKRNSSGQKCPREFVKSVHENSPILSTRIRLLCPLEFFHPIFTIDLSNVNQHPNYLFAVNQHLSSPRIDNPRILMDFFKNSDPNSVVVSSIYYLCRIKIFLWPYVDFHGVVGHKYNRNAGKSIRIPRSSVFFRQEL